MFKWLLIPTSQIQGQAPAPGLIESVANPLLLLASQIRNSTFKERKVSPSNSSHISWQYDSLWEENDLHIINFLSFMIHLIFS